MSKSAKAAVWFCIGWALSGVFCLMLWSEPPPPCERQHCADGDAHEHYWAAMERMHAETER